MSKIFLLVAVLFSFMACQHTAHTPKASWNYKPLPTRAPAQETSWPPKNQHCESARLKSLVITKYKSDRAIDYCDTATVLKFVTGLKNKISKEQFIKITTDVAHIHNRIASLFGTTSEILFPVGIDLIIDATSVGMNGAYSYRDQSISLEVPPHSSTYFNSGIYAHEVGHWITASSNRAIPLAIRHMYESFLHSETVADAIAMAAIGEMTSNPDKLPSCLLGRTIESFQNYNYPRGFFLSTFPTLRQQQCCKSDLVKKAKNANADIMCSTTFSSEEGMVNEDGEVDDTSLQTQEGFDRTPLSLEHIYNNLFSYDNHMIGVPLNSFLKNLSARSKKDLFKIYIALSKELQPTAKYLCSIPSSKTIKQKVYIDTYDLKSHLDLLRATLPVEEKKMFDDAWKKHNLDFAVELDKGYDGVDAESHARTFMGEMMSGKFPVDPTKYDTGFFNASNSCYDFVADYRQNGYSEECQMMCEPH